jgi:hypothetical protein
VRTARAEIRDALGDVGGLGKCTLRGLQPRDIGRKLVISAVAQQPLADADGDVVRIERAFDREQPIALLVFLADADRLVGRAIKFLAHLHFDQRALFLDDDDEIESLREFGEFLAANRPHAGDLEQAQAEIVALDLIDPELVEGLPHIEIRFAGGDDADLGRAASGRDDPVELVGAHEGEHGVALEIVQARFLPEKRIGQPDIQAARRHAKIFRRNDIDAIETCIDHPGRFHRLVHAFECRPRSAEARHRPSVERVIGKFLHAGRIEDRHHHVDEMELRLMRGGRRLRGVVIAHQCNDAAMLR